MAQRSRSSRPGSGSGRSRSGSSGGGSRSGSSRSGSSRSGSSRSGSSRSGGSRSGGSRSGGSRDGGGRGGRGAPPKRGGSNALPLVIALVVVVGAVGLLIAMNSGGDDKGNDRARLPGSDIPEAYRSTTEKRDVPKPPPFPPITEALRQEARTLAVTAKELQAKGEAVYQEAMAARRADDQDLWQEKLQEASEYFYEIQDAYGELEASMPDSEHYGPDEIANHYLGREADMINKAMGRLADIKKQRRL